MPLPITTLVEGMQNVQSPFRFPFEAYTKETLGPNWRYELVQYSAIPVNVVDLCRAMFNAGRVSASKEDAIGRDRDQFPTWSSWKRRRRNWPNPASSDGLNTTPPQETCSTRVSNRMPIRVRT